MFFNEYTTAHNLDQLRAKRNCILYVTSKLTLPKTRNYDYLLHICD